MGIVAQLDRLSQLRLPITAALAPKLSAPQIASLLEVAFWSSLLSEEGRPTRTCIAVRRQGDNSDGNEFATPVPYSEGSVRRLAPSVPPSGALLVAPYDTHWSLWGYSRSRMRGNDAIMLELAETGQVRVSVGPISAFGMFDGRSNPIFGTAKNLGFATALWQIFQRHCPTTDIIETQAIWREALATTDLCKMVLRQGHGGIVLVVPDAHGDWEKHINPFEFKFTLPDTSIREAIRLGLQSAQAVGQVLEKLANAPISEDLRREIEGTIGNTPSGEWLAPARAIAALAQVDGAIIATQDLRVLGFGAKIAVKQEGEVPLFIDEFKPGRRPLPHVGIEAAGGMRHQSSVRFVDVARDCVALIASQDGHLSIAYWDAGQQAVGLLRNVERTL
jgi:hypothetical protein